MIHGDHLSSQRVTVTHLDVAAHIALHRLERCAAQDIYVIISPLSLSSYHPVVSKHIPKSDCKLSAASKNSVVEILLSAATGTSTKLLLRVSKKVDMMMVSVYDSGELKWEVEEYNIGQLS